MARRLRRKANQCQYIIRRGPLGRVVCAQEKRDQLRTEVVGSGRQNHEFFEPASSSTSTRPKWIDSDVPADSPPSADRAGCCARGKVQKGAQGVNAWTETLRHVVCVAQRVASHQRARGGDRFASWSGVAVRLPHGASGSCFFWKLDRKGLHPLWSAAQVRANALPQYGTPICSGATRCQAAVHLVMSGVARPINVFTNEDIIP